MIKLYYGRSNANRMRFMYEKIAQFRADEKKSVLVIVPDQYTLEAEKAAFKMLKTKGLMDVEIMSFSRMAAKIVGTPFDKKYIDDLGRSMILRKVISENKEGLGVFSSVAGKSEFVQMMGRMIQEFKQYQASPETVKEIAESNYEKYSKNMLMKKLSDAALIYAAYEAEIKAKYYDTEDYLTELCNKITEEGLFRDTLVWIEGFQLFSKRLNAVIESLAKNADRVCLSLVYDDSKCRDYSIFAPVEKTFDDVKKIGVACGREVVFEKIPESYNLAEPEAIEHLEKNLFAFPYEIYKKEPESISLWQCENREAEALRIAGEIIRLVSEEGLRFKDIAVACEDLPERRSLISGIFSEAGIEFFDGSRYEAICSKYMQFLLALCRQEKIYASNESIFRILETEIFDISRKEAEILENYVEKYKIVGSAWKKDFYKIDKKGKTDEEAEAELGEVNRIRKELVCMTELFYEYLEGCETGDEFGERFFSYLKNEVHMDEKLQQDADRLKAEGYPEYSGITVQLWNCMVSILGQVQTVLEGYECGVSSFFEILRTGIEALELKLIPTTIDQVLIGSIDTVKMSQVKVLIVAGFNDGIIPSAGGEQGILNDYEKKKLNEISGVICIPPRNELEQEKLSIYQVLSLPEKRLILSYLSLGADDESLNPSQLILKIKKIFPALKEEKSMLGDVILAKSSPSRAFIAGKSFENKPVFISEQSFSSIYGKTLRLSPTSMEAYARCPFAHFLRYAIRADERSVFEISAPEMGNVFHEVLMEFSQMVSRDCLWSVMDEEQCARIIAELAEKIAGAYKNGFMFEGSVGKYRISRIKSICRKTAAMLSDHVNRGGFDRFYFELPFGSGCTLPAVEIGTSGGRKIFIEGRIDRIDIAAVEDGTLVKVIDYKSGSDKVVKKEIVSGYRLQLMLYMAAAAGGMKKKYRNIMPAGVFYFKIQEPSADANAIDAGDEKKLAEFIGKNFRKAYKMDGIVVNEPEVINALDEEFSGFSEIIKVRKLKSGVVKGTGDFTALSRAEFDDLMKNVLEKIAGFCENFTAGDVSISPMQIDEDTKACTWCKYKSICSFDTRIKGFKYR